MLQQCERSPRARCTGARFYTQQLQVGTSTLRARRAFTLLNAPQFMLKDNGYDYKPVIYNHGPHSGDSDFSSTTVLPNAMRCVDKLKVTDLP